MVHFGYVLVTSVLSHSKTIALKDIEPYETRLQEIGGRSVNENDVDQPDILVFVAATGGTENKILDLYQKRAKIHKNEPVFLLAYPQNNSLPACLETLARLHQEGVKGNILYLESETDQGGLKQLRHILNNHQVYLSLNKARIGLIGEPSDWLVASRPETRKIRQSWGPEIIPLKMKDLTQQILKIPDNTILEIQEQLISGAVRMHEPSRETVAETVKVFYAIKQLVRDHQLDALTVKCFDLVRDLSTTGCFALSRLMDEGIVAGCEGDLISTVGMLWAYLLLKEIPWMANPAHLDKKRNRLVLAHCTVPVNMVKTYQLRSHFETNLGVGIAGKLPPGPVTLFRIGGQNMDKLWIAEGDLLGDLKSESLCRTQAEIRLTKGSTVNELLNKPLGNHLVLVYGHHFYHLINWWNTYRIPEA